MDNKSRVAAGLFGIFLGNVGVHDFYLGYTLKGIIHVVLYVIGILLACLCWIPYVGWAILFVGVLPIVIGNNIWSLVEWIIIFAKKDYRDANGNLFQDAVEQ